MSKECCEHCKDFSGCFIKNCSDDCCLVCGDFSDCHPISELRVDQIG